MLTKEVRNGRYILLFARGPHEYSGPPRGFREQGNITIYFKGRRDIFGIKFWELVIKEL